MNKQINVVDLNKKLARNEALNEAELKYVFDNMDDNIHYKNDGYDFLKQLLNGHNMVSSMAKQFTGVSTKTVVDFINNNINITPGDEGYIVESKESISKNNDEESL